VTPFGGISLLLLVGDFFLGHSLSVTLPLEPSQVASLCIFATILVISTFIAIASFVLLFLELLAVRFAHLLCILCYFGCVVSLKCIGLLRFLLDAHTVTCSDIVVAGVVKGRTHLAMLLEVGTE